MSLLQNISNFPNSVNLVESIMMNIQLLFENRTDVYWSYDAVLKRIIGIHQVFKLDKFSEKFLVNLSQCIEAFDPRIKNVCCSWKFLSEYDVKLEINCVLKDSPKEQVIFHISV